MRLTAPDGYQAERSYSIASAPEQTPAIELAIERLDDGEVSPFFHDVAEVGDAIELRGPIGGHFVWEANDGGPLLLLGGGSGVVPLMSMLRHRAAVGSRVPALLLFSSRTWEDVIFRDELLALDAKERRFPARARAHPRPAAAAAAISAGASMPPWWPSLSAGCLGRPSTSSSAAEIRSSRLHRKARSKRASRLP